MAPKFFIDLNAGGGILLYSKAMNIAQYYFS
jgi:hypothetical protein